MREIPFVQIRNNWPVIDVGRMVHTITIQQQAVNGFDASGQVTQWTDFVTAQAVIEPVRGTDVVRSGQTTAQLFLTVGLWYQAGIAENMRVVSHNGATYLIQSIENVLERNAVLLLNCIGIGDNE